MSDESYELALRRIMGHGCETFTTGLGSCWKNGRIPTSSFMAEVCCASCIAHRALYPQAEVYRELACPRRDSNSRPSGPWPDALIR